MVRRLVLRIAALLLLAPVTAAAADRLKIDYIQYFGFASYSKCTASAIVRSDDTGTVGIRCEAGADPAPDSERPLEAWEGAHLRSLVDAADLASAPSEGIDETSVDGSFTMLRVTRNWKRVTVHVVSGNPAFEEPGSRRDLVFEVGRAARELRDTWLRAHINAMPLLEDPSEESEEPIALVACEDKPVAGEVKMIALGMDRETVIEIICAPDRVKIVGNRVDLHYPTGVVVLDAKDLVVAIR